MLPGDKLEIVLLSERKLLVQLRTVSRFSIVLGLFLSIPLTVFFPNELGWQIALALIALTIGIPHGAVDHIVTVPKFASLKMALFLIGYLAVTGLVIWFILSANLIGFQLVVLMSAIHFGIGDASFISELDRRQGNGDFPKVWYALAAGFTPVVLPLVSNQSSAALEEVNPNIRDWAFGFAPSLFVIFVALNLAVTLLMLLKKRNQEALDLALLLGISLIAPPLVAFAFYFGLWHALRHTGRLSLELPASLKAHAVDRPGLALWQAVLAGIPALILVIGFTFWLGLSGGGFSLPKDLLWYLLVVIWALTVPHMALTARLDAKAMGWSKA